MIRILCVVIWSAVFTNNPPPERAIWLDSFDTPLEESWKNRNDSCAETYHIKQIEGQSYLSVETNGSDCFIIKPFKLDLVEYPYLNWKWKANKLPLDGDESEKSLCDVPASIAVVISRNRIFPKSIKYTWSTTLEKGTLTKSPYAKWPARCDIRVLQSGPNDSGDWIHQKVNVLEDFKRFYKKKKVRSKKVRAIVIMTDSDNTGTPSAADYDDIFFSKE